MRKPRAGRPVEAEPEGPVRRSGTHQAPEPDITVTRRNLTAAVKAGRLIVAQNPQLRTPELERAFAAFERFEVRREHPTS